MRDHEETIIQNIQKGKSGVYARRSKIMYKNRDMYFLNQLKYQYISEVFDKIANIPYAVVKGELLSIDAYGSPGCRGFGDVDILISRKNLADIERVLTSLGFKTRLNDRHDRLFLLTYAHQLMEYTKCYDNKMEIEIDLNFDILWGEHTEKSIDMDEFLSDTVEKNIYGIQVKTLPPMKTFFQLALHHYKDMNSIFLLATKKSINYNMFKDFFCFFKRNLNEIPLSETYKISKKYKIEKYIYYILYYTSLIYEDDMLNLYKNHFYCYEGECLIDFYGLNTKERKKWKVDFFTRLNSNDLYSLIKDELSEDDIKKININKRYFMADIEGDM